MFLSSEIPMKQINDLAELAWELGIKIQSLQFPKKYKKEWKLKQVETNFMPIKINYK